MSTTGATTLAIQYVRTVVEAVLTTYKWTLATADNPFQVWNALLTPRQSGIAVISWKSDSVVSQSQDSLVIRARLAITLCARAELADQATMRLQSRGESAEPRLFQIHDRIKGAMLAARLPSTVYPNAAQTYLQYAGSQALTSPDGIPLDGIEQIWEATLKESFSPENL